MARKGRPWVRGAVVLGLAGTMMAAALMSPALAVRLATTSYVKAQLRPIRADIADLNGRIGAVEGVNNLQYIQGPNVVVPAGGVAQAQAVCPAGTSVTGGGLVTTSFDIFTVDTYPTSGGGLTSFGFWPHGRTAWGVDVADFGSGGSVRAYAICQAVDSTGGNYTPGTDPVRRAPRSG